MNCLVALLSAIYNECVRALLARQKQLTHSRKSASMQACGWAFTNDCDNIQSVRYTSADDGNHNETLINGFFTRRLAEDCTGMLRESREWVRCRKRERLIFVSAALGVCFCLALITWSDVKRNWYELPYLKFLFAVDPRPRGIGVRHRRHFRIYRGQPHMTTQSAEGTQRRNPRIGELYFSCGGTFTKELQQELLYIICPWLGVCSKILNNGMVK